MVVFEHARNSTIRFVVESTKPPIIDKVEFRRLNRIIKDAGLTLEEFGGLK